MRKRNFIKRFLYYTGIITIPIITLFFIFMAVIVYRKQQDIETEAVKSAQAVRDNYSLVLDSAATQYDLLARNPRMSISLRNYISHKQIGYLDVILTNSILSNFASPATPPTSPPSITISTATTLSLPPTQEASPSCPSFLI